MCFPKNAPQHCVPCRFCAPVFDQALKARLSGVLGNQEPQVEILVHGLEMLRRVLPRLSPYLLVEIVLPGGTLVALLLYLYRRGNPDIGWGLSLRPRPAVRARAAVPAHSPPYA